MNSIKSFLQHFFTPQEGNNYRAKLLHLDFLTVYLIFALLFTFGVQKQSFPQVLGYATDISVEKLYKLTNEQREKNGLPTVKYNEKLSAAAAQKAKDMFSKNYWAHYGPDGSTPWQFILGSGYQYEYAGENLAKNFLFSDGVVEAWMNSPSHRDNILRKDYEEIGFALSNGVLNGEETTLVVQMFGKPLSTPLPTPVPPAESLGTQTESPGSEEIKNLVTQNSPSLISPKLSININMIFFLVLLTALTLDFYLGFKMGVFRRGSKHLAHIIFIGFVLLSLFVITKGTII